MPRAIEIRPGRPITKGNKSFFPGFSIPKTENPGNFKPGTLEYAIFNFALYDIIYHTRAREGIVKIRVRLSSPRTEKGSSSTGGPAEKEAAAEGKKRTM